MVLGLTRLATSRQGPAGVVQPGLPGPARLAAAITRLTRAGVEAETVTVALDKSQAGPLAGKVGQPQTRLLVGQAGIRPGQAIRVRTVQAGEAGEAILVVLAVLVVLVVLVLRSTRRTATVGEAGEADARSQRQPVMAGEAGYMVGAAGAAGKRMPPGLQVLVVLVLMD